MKHRFLFLTLLTVGLIINSQAVAITDRELAKCDLRWGEDRGEYDCQYNVQSGRLILTLYLDTDEEREITITPQNLMFFPTNYRYKLEDRELISLVNIFYREESTGVDNNLSNRIDLELPQKAETIHAWQRKQLIEFFNSHRKSKQDKQSIQSQMEYLRSPDSSIENLSGEAAIDRLLEMNECARCDLSRTDLSNLDLTEANLEGANLQNALLSNSSLEGAYLLGANLADIQLEETSLAYAELPYSSLTRSNLEKTNLSLANLHGVDLSNAISVEGNLSAANLGQANLQNANLARAQMTGINLRGANLTMANLDRTNLSVGIVFESESLKRNVVLPQPSNLSKANLTQASLVDANMQGVILYRASLSNARLSGANLSTDFLKNKGIQIRNSTPIQSNLVEVNLHGANLENANLDGSNLCKATMPDGSISVLGCN